MLGGIQDLGRMRESWEKGIQQGKPYIFLAEPDNSKGVGFQG